MPNHRKAPPNPNKLNSWGGYTINFEGQTITMAELMGEKTLGCGAMLSRLWQYAKSQNLTSKSRPYQPKRILRRERVEAT